MKPNIIKLLPFEREFRPAEIADRLYPHLVLYDTEGRKFNRGAATVARILRKIKGVEEVRHAVFYFHREYAD